MQICGIFIKFYLLQRLSFGERDRRSGLNSSRRWSVDSVLVCTGTTDTWTLQPATFIEMLKPSKGWQRCSLKFRVCTLLFFRCTADLMFSIRYIFSSRRQHERWTSMRGEGSTVFS
eukprot:jgi/Botrbrau1/23584/Bobra.0141s0048.1